MDLVDKLQKLLPEFKDNTDTEKSEILKNDMFEGYIFINKQARGGPKINMWVNYSNDNSGIMFSDENILQTYKTLVKEVGYSDFILNPSKYRHERAMMKEGAPAIMASTQFFIIYDIETESNVDVAKKLLAFYETNCDPDFEDKF